MAMKRSDFDAEYILDQHAFASEQYAATLSLSEQVEQLFKSDFNVPLDAGTPAHANAPEIGKPARARAIVEKFLSMLSLRATHSLQVVPLDNSRDELEKTSKLERGLRGYQLAYQLETKRSPWLDGPYWYMLRGRMCLQSKFDPSRLGTDELPIRTYALDPNSVFPVWDVDGIGWYTCRTQAYARTLRQQIERRRQGRAKDRWQKVDLGGDPNALLTITEYWDADWCAAVVSDDEEGEGAAQLLYVRNHDYGFVNLSEVHCMSTPLPEREWAHQPVLALIMDSLKGMYKLVAKNATAVDLFYWPKILVQSPSGGAVILDSGAPGVESVIPMDAKVTVISPTPNDRVLAQLMGWYQSDVQLGGIPDIAWGSEPANLQSGFAVSQVLGQVMDKIAPHERALEMGFGWDWSHKLKLLDKFGGLDGFKFQVPVEARYGGKTGTALAY